MAVIKTRKADVIWNYIGTIVSMTSGFILLPMMNWAFGMSTLRSPILPCYLSSVSIPPLLVT